MYAFAGTASGTKRRPNVLFVLQGTHHLRLYRNIFRCCPEFQWLCLFPKFPMDEMPLLRRYAAAYGLKFFMDGMTAIAHYGNIDAVITTWAVPHAVHIRHIRYITLAHDLDIPTFEMQHGLFQIGLTCREESSFIGSSMPGALVGLDTPNLVEDHILWGGGQGIGYPPCRPETDMEDEPSAPSGEGPIVFLTNFHWNLMTESERSRCYDIILDSVAGMPTQEFLLFPHPGEVAHGQFRIMAAQAAALRLSNLTIVEDRNRIPLEPALRQAPLVVSSVSTVLLDCEAAARPTVVFRTATQSNLLQSLRAVTAFDTAEELIGMIGDVLHRGYRPRLVTGHLQAFMPARLVARLKEAIDSRSIPTARQIARAIGHHVPLAP